MKVKSLSCVRPSVTPWTAAHQAPPSMGFSRQEYWSGVPLPSPEPPGIVVSKTDKSSCPHEMYILVEETNNKQANGKVQEVLVMIML